MPDFERRSSASFISSKEGGTPDSFRRSLMNRRSSYCLRVSISTNPQAVGVVCFRDVGVKSQISPSTLETNHEHTVYVPYVFRNILICSQRNQPLSESAR